MQLLKALYPIFALLYGRFKKLVTNTTCNIIL